MPYPEHVSGVGATFERWSHERHGPALLALNGDPEVTAFLGGELPAEQVADVSRTIADHWETHGFGLWAVVLDGECVGFSGACHPGENWPPEVRTAVELGWRLARSAWGRGLATEGARHALASLGSDHRVISLIAPGNERSVAVARRLGMRPGGETRNQRISMPVTIYELP